MHRVLRVTNAPWGLCSKQEQPTCIHTVQYAASTQYNVHAYGTFLPGLVRAFLSNSHLL